MSDRSIFVEQPLKQPLAALIEAAVVLLIRPRNNVAHIIGVMVSETSIDTAIANDKRHGEFAEQPADDAAHHQNRNEDRDQAKC